MGQPECRLSLLDLNLTPVRALHYTAPAEERGTEREDRAQKNPRSFTTFLGERGRDRTGDRRIKSPLLCQLSYAPGRTIAGALSAAKATA